MAVVGSTIFDQTMFGKDIDKQMADTIEQQTADLTQKRVGIIESKLNAIHTEKDSLDKLNAEMQADINAHPWILQKSVTNSQEKLILTGIKKDDIDWNAKGEITAIDRLSGRSYFDWIKKALPLILTIPIPESDRAVAMAAIVSFS